jgi:hypothetical protein
VLEVIDGRPIESRTITLMAQLNLAIGLHPEQLPAFVSKLEHVSIVLGLPWLQLHHVTFKFKNQGIDVKSSYFQQHC